METLIKPAFRVEYNGKNITEDITRYLISVTYTDKVEGESDEIEIRVEDTEALWCGAWYPTKGDKLSLYIGYQDGDQVFAGTFEIDETELIGPPDTVSIRALATGIKAPLRTLNSAAFENVTLRQIAEQIAGAHGYGIVGEIEDVKFNRITQNRETDLGFLRRIAKEYGHVFSVRDNKLVFSSVIALERGDAIMEVDRTDVIRYRILDKTSQSFNAAQVGYHDPNSKQVYRYSVSDKVNPEGEHLTEVTKGDTKIIRSRTENEKQAELKAKAALWDANSRQQELSITLPGVPYLVAGNNFNLTGFGVVSGKYHIMQSTHRIDRSGGYITEVEAKRVGYIERVKQKPKKPRKKKEVQYRVIE